MIFLVFFTAVLTHSLPNHFSILIENRPIQRGSNHFVLNFSVGTESNDHLCTASYTIAADNECEQFLYMGWDSNHVTNRHSFKRRLTEPLRLMPTSSILDINEECIDDIYYPYLVYLADLVNDEKPFKIVADNDGTVQFLDDQYQFCVNPLSTSLFWQTMEHMATFDLVQIEIMTAE